MKDFVNNRQIYFLYHFTKLSNLESILKNGILSRRTMIDANMDFDFNDSQRLDGRLDAISCSIMWPNYKMFYKIRNENNTDKYIIISIGARLLYEKDCLFFPTNAARRYDCGEADNQCRGKNALEKLYEDNVNGFVRVQLTKDSWPTDPQAEVLVKENIPISYIRSIKCEDEATCEIVRRMCAAANFSTRIEVYKSLFGPRKDYNDQKAFIEKQKDEESL